jgi:integrase
MGRPLKFAFEIPLFTGLRRSDAVRLGPQHLRDQCHIIATKKSGELVTLEIPLHPTLARHLENAPAGLVYIQTAAGRSRSVAAFTGWIKEAAAKAGLPSNSSPHGLRKAACRRLAEAGCSGPQIQAITGHRNLAEVDTYIREVNRKALAQGAMAAIIDSLEETKP